MRQEAVAKTDKAGVHDDVEGGAEKERHGAPDIADYRTDSVAQRQLIDDIRVSPRVMAQRARLSAIFGDPVQMKIGRSSRAASDQGHAAQSPHSHGRRNDTGMPAQLKAGIEWLSGISMDGVKVHYNSPQPAQLNALAYAQGSDIHLSPGQEAHLPHEAWHVVQQAQGRVAPTRQMKDAVSINDDTSLEREADAMGARASTSGAVHAPTQLARRSSAPVVQRFIDDEGMENGVEPIGVAGRYVVHHGATYLETDIGTFYLEPTGVIPVHAPGEDAPSAMPGASASSGGWADYPPSSTADVATEPDLLMGRSQSGSMIGTGFPSLPVGDPQQLPPLTFLAQPGLVTDDSDGLTGGGGLASLVPGDDNHDMQPIAAEDDEFELDLSPDEENIEEDDEPEKSTKDSRNHYLDIIESDLRQAQKNFEEESSDSDIDEDDPDIRAGRYTKKELEAARRKRKSMDLEAIMSTAEPVGDDEMERIQALESSREADVKSRQGKRGRYTKATIRMLRERGLDMKRTNLYHNTYLRRAVREATTSAERTSSTSAQYDRKQKIVRNKLLETIVSDHKKMGWKEEDFSSKEKWNTFQWMLKNNWSNPPSGVRLHQKTDIKPDDKLNPRAAFHHGYWKESEGARSSPFALTPPNLTLRHDEREMDQKKKRKRIDAGQEVYKPGSHEYDHRTNGYQKGDAARFPGRWQSGGHFSAMDAEAVAHTIKPMLAKRARKLEVAKRLVDKSKKRRRGSDKPAKPTDNPPSAALSMPDVAPPTLDVASVLPGVAPATLDIAQPDLSSLAADASQEALFDNGMALSLLSFSDEEIAELQEFVDALRADYMQNQPRAQTLNGANLQSNIVGIGALEQFEHECGQMAVFNASIMRTVGGNTMHNVLQDAALMGAFRAAASDQQSLNAVGPFRNDVDEVQIMAMLEQINATDVAVVNNYQQLRGILQRMRQGDQEDLAAELGEVLYQHYLPGVTAMLNFVQGATPALNLVVNTAADAGGHVANPDAVLHWIAVRVERHQDGSLQVFFMDSLNGAHSYTDLLNGLRTLLQ